jgi:hypothetical protein
MTTPAVASRRHRRESKEMDNVTKIISFLVPNGNPQKEKAQRRRVSRPRRRTRAQALSAAMDAWFPPRIVVRDNNPFDLIAQGDPRPGAYL